MRRRSCCGTIRSRLLPHPDAFRFPRCRISAHADDNSPSSKPTREPSLHHTGSKPAKPEAGDGPRSLPGASELRRTRHFQRRRLANDVNRELGDERQLFFVSPASCAQRQITAFCSCAILGRAAKTTRPRTNCRAVSISRSNLRRPIWALRRFSASWCSTHAFGLTQLRASQFLGIDNHADISC